MTREQLQAAVEQEVERMELAQRKKVIDLARRIHPGLTDEDIRNPHDFPDLDDPDWHFEDGTLAGIQSVQIVLRALFRSLEDNSDAAGEDNAKS